MIAQISATLRPAIFVFVALLLSPLLRAQQPSVIAELATDMVVTNETAVLRLTIRNAQIYGWPITPKVAPLTFKQGSTGRTIINGRQSLNLSYAVSSYKPGVFEIPVFEVKTSKGVLKTEALTLRVFDEDVLQEGVAEIEHRVRGVAQVQKIQIPYFSGVFLTKDHPYVGEEQSVILKLYVSRNIRIQEPQLAEMETLNLAAWRFENRDLQGLYDRGGELYQSLTYVSTVAALKEGPATLGPGKVEPLIQGQINQRGFTRWLRFNSRFDFPKIEMAIRPLPEPKPTDFQGAVGNFKITSLPSAQELELGESLTVDLSVTGSGNLDKLLPPVLQADERDWKSFDAIRIAQGAERRQAGGTISFTQVVRPLKSVKELPPYKLVFFDPLIEDYRTAVSAAYPLAVTGSADPAVAASIPLVAMTDGTMKTLSLSRPWLWQLIPAFITIVALALWFSRRLRGKKMANLPKQEFAQDLSKLKDAASTNRPEFFRALGRFLEQWPHSEIEKEAKNWMETRDEICFAPQQENEQVLPKEREAILKILQKCAPLLLAAFFLAPHSAEASLEKLWEESNYAEGAKVLRQKIEKAPTPSAYYNLALFEDRLDRPAEALLAYYRALASDPTLDAKPATELATKRGAIRPETSSDDDWLAKFPRSTYREIFLLGVWLVVLAFALRLFLNKPSWKSRVTAICLTLAPLVLILGGLAWWFYPEDISNRPLLAGSVVMSDEPLRNSPHAAGESFRSIAAGSFGHITATRGNWSYLEFPKGLNGWLPKDSLTPIALQDQ